jgi:predicted amidohydrolase YtcJ
MEELVDQLLRNARIWTVDDAQPWAQAVGIRDGRIAWVGDDSGATEWVGPGTEVIDAGGRLVLPGFVDAHNHLRLGTGADAVHLGGAMSLDEIRERIGDWLSAHPNASWVYGETWEYPALPDGRRPRAQDLEGATGGRPAFLLDLAVHTAWLNREALDVFGITRDTVRVPFGLVEHDEVTGEPTGCINDFATHGLSRAGLDALKDVVPAFSSDAQYQRVRESLAMATRFGITTVVEPQNSMDDLALFTRARAEGTLTSRVVAALFHPVGTADHEIDEFDQARRVYNDDWFRTGPIKLYIDDTIEPHLAAMLEPYTNLPQSVGTMYYAHEEFAELAAKLDARGFQCFVHAIGDRGVRTVLDGFEHARRVNGARDSRHQIVHVEASTPQDLRRFGELGVVACMQPRHSRPEITEVWKENVGEHRWPHSWGMRTIAEHGGVLALSSDWNTSEMDPLLGLYSAQTRARADGTDAWVPEETLSLQEAVQGYTMGSAYANFAEGDRGSVSVGKYADLVVLSNNIFELEPAALLETEVELTMVGGTMPHRTL